MVYNWRMFENDMRRHGSAIMIGAAVGALAANYAISQGADLNSIIAAGKGIIDDALGRGAALDLAKTKMYTVFMTLGGYIGYAADKFMFSRRRMR